MIKHLILCTLGCLPLLLVAQPDERLHPGPNLVANPSFEDLRRKLPGYDLDGSIAFRNCIDKWMSPTKTTPDLKMSVNQDGTDVPHQGNSMVAILSHNPQSKRSDTYREYIQTKLNKPLIEGEEYYVEFWICRAHNAALVSNNIGVAFSPVPILHQDYEPLLAMKPVLNEKHLINPSKKEWVKVSGNFVASNREQFLIIGNFFINRQTKFEKAADASSDAFNQPYYLIDDVGVYQLNVQPEPEESLATLEVAVGQVIQLDRIYFETAKWDLLEASFEELAELHRLLNEHPSMQIEIHGHTDSRGGENYNQNLSENRAKAVHQYLLDQGVDPSRIAY
ncbi:MAG: OmpA family protein, partial [Saprospiraceae bacterium]